jgi:hypothetical protein
MALESPAARNQRGVTINRQRGKGSQKLPGRSGGTGPHGIDVRSEVVINNLVEMASVSFTNT